MRLAARAAADSRGALPSASSTPAPTLTPASTRTIVTLDGGSSTGTIPATWSRTGWAALAWPSGSRSWAIPPVMKMPASNGRAMRRSSISQECPDHTPVKRQSPSSRPTVKVMRINLPGTVLSVHPLCLGGNVFGASADQDQSFEVLDAYQAAGGNFIDTSDSYLWRMPGNYGGESETIIGNWLTARGNRADIVVATKVGSCPDHPGLSAENIAVAAEESLRRLRTDYIDLYYAHRDDPDTPLEETLGAFDALVRAGKVRYIAASNYSAPRLAEALRI